MKYAGEWADLPRDHERELHKLRLRSKGQDERVNRPDFKNKDGHGVKRKRSASGGFISNMSSTTDDSPISPSHASLNSPDREYMVLVDPEDQSKVRNARRRDPLYMHPGSLRWETFNPDI